MTVRDAVAVLTDAKTLYIGWNGSITDFDKEDELMMDAYGKYKVSRINAVPSKDDESAYEIDIAACPIKEETA